MSHTREASARIPDRLEHRFGRRIPLEIPVKLSLAGRMVGTGLLRSASISGALIETSLELPVFTNLAVVLPKNGETPARSPELAACVVRHDAAGFAVEWRDMACAPLVELLQKFSGRPAADLRIDEAFATGRVACASP